MNFETISLNGEYIQKKDAHISPFDHGFLYGDAVYETLLISKGNILFFQDHWNRLLTSLTSLGISLSSYYENEEKMQQHIETLILKNTATNARLRITISRGENHFNFTSSPNPTLLIALSSLPEYEKELFINGIGIQTMEEQRPTPTVKSTNFIASILGRRSLQGTENFEAVFTTPEGFFREGTVSNVFGIQGKTVYIAPRKSVLPGTLQSLVEKIFLKNGFSIVEKNFTEKEIFDDFDELYISNSLIGIMPVQKINGKIFQTLFPLFEEYFGEDFFERYL